MGSNLAARTTDLGTLLSEIDRHVARWSMVEDGEEGQALLALTKCVNEIASSQGIVGAAFSVLDPSQSSIVLTKTYMRKSSNLNEIIDDEFMLFPYKSPVHLAKTFPRFIETLNAAGVGFPNFVDSLFQMQRGSQRTDEPDGMVPEFLKRDIESALIATYKEICEYLVEWLYLLYSAASSNYGLLASNATPNLGLTVGEALSRALENTPHHSKESAFKFDDFDLFFRAFGNKELIDCDPLAQLLMECTLGDVVPSFAEPAVFTKRASILSNKLKLDPNSPIIYRLHNISQKAPFPLVPYLSLVALIKRPIAHVTIPLHSTRTFKHRVVISEGVVEQRNCGVFLLATVDEEIASVPVLTALCKAMASPILDEVYYGGFQRKLIERDLISNSIRSFAHQIRSLASNIETKWLVPHSEWSNLESRPADAIKYLVKEEDREVALQVIRQKTNAYQIAPDPKIFSALSSTLKIWSLTFTLADLFGNSDLGPQNACELFQCSATTRFPH